MEKVRSSEITGSELKTGRLDAIRAPLFRNNSV
jgi:hypothetical protein